MKRLIYGTNLLIAALVLSINLAQAQTTPAQAGQSEGQTTSSSPWRFSSLRAQARPPQTRDGSMQISTRRSAGKTAFTPLVFDSTAPVFGGGTVGRLTKWTQFASGRSLIGDTTIFEDNAGNVGIGTDSPTSRLTVAGMVQITLGGLTFPDGSVQTTAGLSSLFHDASLTGNGTNSSLLGIAPGGVQTVHLSGGAVTAAKIANGTVIRSLNGLFDDVTLTAGVNITITPSGNTLTIAAPNSLMSITHDRTLTGNGTAAASLGVSVPLILTGSAGFDGILQATNTTQGGRGISATGGGGGTIGGDGVHAAGGGGGDALGGAGVRALGGFSNSATAGDGVDARGGDSDSYVGGSGVTATGGNSNSSFGGHGVRAEGGVGSGAGNKGGIGIVAFGGLGVNGATVGPAGQFGGDVHITGNLSKAGGSFKIDHPLDPENKYLYHSFVESPDMMNIYNGNVTTDENGDAVITLPDWFEALNRDFRYQLTVIGTFAQAIVADEIQNHRFTIKTNSPNVKVSWQVTGIRHDAYADKHRIPVEEAKPEAERGSYLHPDAYGQLEERSVQWARHPQVMRQLKQRRLQLSQH